MNRYTELRERQQKEFDSLPLGWAFNRRQFAEMMAGWGLDPEKDLGKIARIPGGGFVQKKDLDQLHRTIERLDGELRTAVAEDPTGEGFIYEMFLAELENHEYGYTGDVSDTLEALGYTEEEVMNDPRLKKGLNKARQKIRRG